MLPSIDESWKLTIASSYKSTVHLGAVLVLWRPHRFGGITSSPRVRFFAWNPKLAPPLVLHSPNPFGSCSTKMEATAQNGDTFDLIYHGRWWQIGRHVPRHVLVWVFFGGTSIETWSLVLGQN